MQGQQATLAGNGFGAGQQLDITLYSSPVSMGTVTSDSSGAFTRSVTIPAGTPAGGHRIVVSTRDGRLQAGADITVVSAGPSRSGSGGRQNQPGRLSFTGFNVEIFVMVAGIAIVLGAGLRRVGRRRSGWSL